MIVVYKGNDVDVCNFMAHCKIRGVIEHWLDISCEDYGLVYVGF